MAVLVKIPLEQIDDHPDNPRLVFRDDVVSSIASNLGDEFPQKHAVHLRPVDGRYQLIAGHHRKRAAQQKGLAEVWAWVEELDDEAAFMELATSNSQGELSPLEIGLHALKAVPLAQGKKGSGLAGYAERMGKTKQYVGELRTAAEVLMSLTCKLELTSFLDKAKHLATVHKADADLWPVLVEHMLKGGWTAADTDHWVGKVKAFETVLASVWEAIFLPKLEVVQRFLSTREFSPQTVAALCSKAASVEANIEVAAEKLGVDGESYIKEFEAWLVANKGAASWDIRKIEQVEREILERLAPKSDDCWHHGNWRDHVSGLKDGSVALVLTDPPYGIDYQSDFRLDRRQARKNETIANDTNGVEEFLEAMTALYPKLKEDAQVFCFCHWSNEHDFRVAMESAGLKIRNSLVWEKNNTGMGDPKTTFAPKHERILYGVKGSPTLFEREADVLHADRVNTDRHPTEKPVDLLKRIIEITTVSGELVADPFGGVASSLVASKELGRAYWGCELSEEYHKAGEARLR